MGFAGAWGDFGFISSTCFLVFGRQQRANGDLHRAEFTGQLCVLHFCNTLSKKIGARTKSSKDIIEKPKYVTWAIFRVRRWVCSCALFIDITITIYPGLVTAV